MRSLCVALVASVLVCACDKPVEPSGSSAPGGTTKGPSTAAAKPTAKATAGGDLAWDGPAKWKSIPNPNSMRIATYLVPRADADPDDGEMSVTRVGGGVDANINRWKAQFNPAKADSAKRSERTVGELKVTIFEVAGTYAGMAMPGQPGKERADWALLSAIVEGPSGDPWFFKLTGPEKTIAAARADFDSFVGSFRVK